LGKNKVFEQMEALDEYVSQGVIDGVLGVVKSGKEATVYCCEAGDDLVAAKIYRGREVRGFSNDAVYRAGRVRKPHRREARAMENRSRFGREVAFGAWVDAEYETLDLLHRGGADVPRPIAHSGSIILMEYIGDEDEPAPMLSAGPMFVTTLVALNVVAALCGTVLPLMSYAPPTVTVPVVK
jgi:RIO kinase 1